MPQSDRDYLRDYVRAQPSRQSDETLTAYLRRVGVDEGDPKDLAKDHAKESQAEQGAEARAQERTPAGAQRARANTQLSQQRAAKEAQLAAEEEARKQQAKNASLIGKGLYAAGIAPNKAADTVESLQNWIATRPTPGGRGGMLLLLLVFGAFIIPVAAGGYTRAQLAWLTLLGRTEIDDSGAPGKPPEPSPKPPPGGKPPEPSPKPPPGSKPLDFTLPLPGAINGPSLPH